MCVCVCALGSLPRSLKVVNLAGNPCCLEDEYRIQMLRYLPRLYMLDKVEVDESERKVASYLRQLAGEEEDSGHSDADSSGSSEEDSELDEQHEEVETAAATEDGKESEREKDKRELLELLANVKAGKLKVEAPSKQQPRRKLATDMTQEELEAELSSRREDAKEKLDNLGMEYNMRVKKMREEHRRRILEEQKKLKEEMLRKSAASQAELDRARARLAETRSRMLERARERTEETQAMHEAIERRIAAAAEAGGQAVADEPSAKAADE